jgi:RNA polymerase sigma factor (TIGR02999 family)
MAKERAGNTLTPTGLVHEVYVRLLGPDGDGQFSGKAHFFGAAATAMRRILVDRARRKRRQVHGGDRRRQDLDSNVVAPVPDDELLAVDAALAKFAETEPLKAKLVELRYFVGLTGEQTAEVLGLSARTVDRHWVYARAWLRREMECMSSEKNEHRGDAENDRSSH